MNIIIYICCSEVVGFGLEEHVPSGSFIFTHSFKRLVTINDSNLHMTVYKRELMLSYPGPPVRVPTARWFSGYWRPLSAAGHWYSSLRSPIVDSMGNSKTVKKEVCRKVNVKVETLTL